MPFQSFPFAPPLSSVTITTVASVISAVPLDGSASVLVPFLQAFSQYVQSVVASYTPPVNLGYAITWQIFPIAPATSVATSLVGFRILASGGPAGTTGAFSYIATGL